MKALLKHLPALLKVVNIFIKGGPMAGLVALAELMSAIAGAYADEKLLSAGEARQFMRATKETNKILGIQDISDEQLDALSDDDLEKWIEANGGFSEEG